MDIAGKTIEIDRSGMGHAWQNATPDNCPANIAQEIEGEIIDGKQAECDNYVASNGLHYRWA